MATIAEYYFILQVRQGATVAELKAAYRRRAKELHPDRNKSATAHHDFILLTEAYEFLSVNPNAQEYIYTHTTTSQTSDEHMYQTRQRAATYANMQYSDFEKSDYYRETEALAVVAHHLYLVFVIVAMLGLFAFFVVVLGPVGILTSVVMAALAIPLLIKLVPANGPINLPLFGKAILLIGKSRWLPVIAVGVFNLYVFFNIGLQTLIPFSLLWQVYVLLVLATFGVLKWLVQPAGRFKLFFWSLFLSPLAFSIFLTLNYSFSNTPVQETYDYVTGTESTRHGQQSTTLIFLPGNAYEEYAGVRMFFDYEEMRGTSSITYTFENGLFGIRVMKDHTFNE